MIAEGVMFVSLMCANLCAFPQSPGIPLYLEVDPERYIPPGYKPKPKPAPPKPKVQPKRTITIPYYAPPLRIPQWLNPK